MKKALSAVLALLMILSCMVFPTVAEDATNGNTVLLSNCDTNTGWQGGITVDTQNKAEGSGSIFRKSDGSGSTAAFMFEWVEGKDLDISEMKYMVFDLYLSDVSLASLPAEIELHSEHNGSYTGGWTDVNEVHVRPADIANYFVDAPVAGWNKVVIPLSDFVEDTPGTTIYDSTKMMYLRMYLPSDGSTVGTAGTEYTMNLDNVHFTDTPYVAPEPEKPESVKPTLISITNCDQLDDGFAKGDHLVLDTTDPSQGKGSIARTFEGATTGMVDRVPTIKFEYTLPNGKTYDATLMNQVSFDVWVSDPAAFAETKFELEVYGIKDGVLDGDTKEIVKSGTLSDLKGDELVAGWNTISVDMATMTNKGATMESFCWFRLFSTGGAAGLEGQTSTIKLDNVYMTADPVSYEDKIPLTTSPSTRASAGTISPSYGSGNYMHSVTYANTTYDITGMTYVEFDVKIDNEMVNKIDFRMDITSAGKSDYNQITRTRTLSRWNGGDLPVGEWVHVKVPISFLQGSTGNHQIDHYEDKDGDGKAETPIYVLTDPEDPTTKIPDMTTIPDLTKINFFRFFSNNMGDGFKAQVGEEAYTATYGCEMKNFCFTKELEGGEELVFDAETMVSNTHGAQFKGGTTADVQLNSGGTLRDIDGDGDNEWVAQEKAEAGTLVDGNGNPIAGGLPVSFSFEDTVRNAAYANLVSLRFDFYCNDEAVLNHRFDFEMTSSRGSDVSEATANAILRSFIIEDLGDGWYTVDIPLSKLTGRANGSRWSAPKAAFSANRFNFFRMFAHSNLNWSAGCVMAVDNIRVTRAAADQIEEKFEIPAGAIPFTSNVLDFVDLNSGNNYFHGATSRAKDAKITPNVVDTTIYNLLCGNLYLENYDEIAATGFCFEITSAGRCDSEESSIPNAALANIFTRFDGQPLQDGNNYVYLDVLNSPYFTSHACDMTQADYIRIFNQTNVTGTKNATAKFSDIHFANAEILDVTLANDITIEGVSINIDENVSLNIVANIHPSLNATATLTIDGLTTEVKGTRIGTTNQVVFQTPVFQENEYGKLFTFELIAKTADGKVISATLTDYSVKQVIVNALEGIKAGTFTDATGGKLATMLTDLLVYAAAVEKQEGETALITEGVDLSKASTFAPMSVYTNPLNGEQGACPAAFIGLDLDALSFAAVDDAISGTIVFKADSVEGLKVKVAAGSLAPVVYDTFTDNGDGTYSFTIDLRVFDVNTPFVCTFEGYEGYSYTFSMGTQLMMSRELALEALENDPENAEAQAAVEIVEAIACLASSIYDYVASQQ